MSVDESVRELSGEELRARVRSLEAENRSLRERRLGAQVELLAGGYQAIAEVMTATPSPGLDCVLKTILEHARRLVDAEYGLLGIGGSAGDPFDSWVESGVPRGTAPLVSPRPIGILATGRQAGARRVQGLDESLPALPTPHPRIRTLLTVPLRTRDRLVGSLCLANKTGADDFDDEDARLVTMLAGRAAAAIETSTAVEGEVRRRTWLQAVIDQTPEGVVIADASGRFVVNRRALEFALQRREAADPFGNQVIFDVRSTDGTPLAWEQNPLVRALLLDEKTIDIELAVASDNGQLVPVAVSAAPVVAPDGVKLGAVAVLRDLTAFNQLQRLREEWAAVIAHDLRQPVSSIVFSDEILARSALGLQPLEARAVDRIRTATRRMMTMIDELVDSSLIEAKRVKLCKEPVALPEVVRDVLEQLEGQLAGRCVSLEVERGLPLVPADRSRIERVLGNIVANALKYGQQHGDLRITIGHRPEAVEVAVTNLGEGLTTEQVHDIFGRFYRGRSDRTTRGLGLGLYICKGLVEAHGGRIWAECGEGKTTFCFTLPLG